MKRFFCVALAMILVFLTASCGKTPQNNDPSGGKEKAEQPVFTARPGRWSKHEAVFATLSADGAVQQIRVTDRIQTDVPRVRVDDLSALNHIENLKGSEQPQIEGVNLTWHMQSTDLYYAGETEKNLPISLRIGYTLDGKAIDAASLRGRSGAVSIHVQTQNRHRQGDLYTPFLLAGGMILPQNAKDVQIENGGTFGDGNRDIAFSLLLPGMGESLGLKNEGLLPESFSVSFRTDRFSMGEMYFVLLPLSTLQLEDALRRLFGSVQLPELDTDGLLRELRAFGSDARLREMMQFLPQSSAVLHTAADAMQAYAAEQPLLDVFSRYLTQENAELLAQTIDSLSGTTLQEYAELLQNPTFIALLADMSTVSAAFSRIIPQLSAFISELQSPQVRAAVSALPDTMAKLDALSRSLKENEQLMRVLTDFSESGIMTRFSSLFASVQTMLDSGALETLQTLAGKADSLQTRIESLLRLGKNYGIFTDAPKDAETSVYFVLKVNQA